MMREMLQYLKDLVERNFDLPELKLDGDQLNVKLNNEMIRFGLTKNRNSYYLYDYTLWYWKIGDGKNFPMKGDYKQDQIIVDFLNATVFNGYIKEEVVKKQEEQKQKREKPINNLFDFL